MILRTGIPVVAAAALAWPGFGEADDIWPEFRSHTGGIIVEPGAQLRLDAAMNDGDLVDLNNGSQVSRARVSLQTALWDKWESRFSYNFVNDGGLTGISSAYVDYTGLETVRFRIGQFKEPFSLQNMTGSSNVNFIKRNLTDTFTTERTLGAGIFAGGHHWSLGAGVFSHDIGDELDSASIGASSRATWAPVNYDGRVLHIGGSLSWRDTGDDRTLSFAPRPESSVSIRPLVSTTNPQPVDADDFYRYGMEALWAYDRFLLQGEYIRVSVNRAVAGNPKVDFSGYYAEAAWFLTGDRRPYRGWRGTFGGMNPNAAVGRGGWGAWQIAARISHIDLSDRDIDGGEETNLTLGLNWFPNDYLRFSANYIQVLDVRGGPSPGDEPAILLVRAQLDF